jgi:hypothetical protein
MNGQYEWYLFYAVRHGNPLAYRILCFCEACHRPVIGDGDPAFCDPCWD